MLEAGTKFKFTAGTTARADALVDYVYSLLSRSEPGRGDRSSVLRFALDRGLKSLERDAAEFGVSGRAAVPAVPAKPATAPTARPPMKPAAVILPASASAPDQAKGRAAPQAKQGPRATGWAKYQDEEREADYMAGVSAEMFAEDPAPNTPPF